MLCAFSLARAAFGFDFQHVWRYAVVCQYLTDCLSQQGTTGYPAPSGYFMNDINRLYRKAQSYCCTTVRFFHQLPLAYCDTVMLYCVTASLTVKRLTGQEPQKKNPAIAGQATGNRWARRLQTGNCLTVSILPQMGVICLAVIVNV